MLFDTFERCSKNGQGVLRRQSYQNCKHRVYAVLLFTFLSDDKRLVSATIRRKPFWFSEQMTQSHILTFLQTPQKFATFYQYAVPNSNHFDKQNLQVFQKRNVRYF